MVHADLICVPQMMSGEQALAAQIGGYSCPSLDQLWLHCAMPSAMVVAAGAAQASRQCLVSHRGLPAGPGSG
jgi:hypothetical protein